VQIDLAGSENVQKTGIAWGSAQARRGVKINMSLDHLGFCIRKLADIDDKLSPEKQAVLKEKVPARLRRGRWQRITARPRRRSRGARTR
jgi:hypothetical protein